MKGGTVQINWHEMKPILTLDFHPKSGFLATGGADFDIKMWIISSCDAEKKAPTASYQSNLAYHGSAVNILRFSPSGEQLASGADGGELLLWKLHSTDVGQTWKVLKTLSFHRKDVLDMQWSTDGTYLFSGSVDNSCIIWDANKGCVHQILDGHLHYVQGVAWDPLGHYVASLSSDRTCRVYVNKPQKTKSKGPVVMNFVPHVVIAKAEQKHSDDPKNPSTKVHLFHDETLPSFFRRLAWSPDGSFLVAPAGSYRLLPAPDTLNTAYIFSRKDLSKPALQLPAANKPIVAVRFCPVVFELRGSASEKDTNSLFRLPYRFVFAVATLNSVYIYDTESIPPIAIFAGLHYAAITDIAWSPNAQFLALSSQDGYCTLVQFDKDELGSPLPNKPVSETEGQKEEEKLEIATPEVKKTVDSTRNDKMEFTTPEAKKTVEGTGKGEGTPMEITTPEVQKTVEGTRKGERTPMEIATPEVKTVEGTRKGEGTPMQTTMPEIGKTVEGTRKGEGTPMQEIGKIVSERNEGAKTLNQSKVAPSNVSNKPAKRRITPMAIDK